MRVFQEFVLFLSKIPDVVWAAVIASILTLGGVLLTNRGSYKRLKSQLNFDANERNRERDLGLKREVYLEAAEAVSSAIRTISRMMNLNLDTDALSKDYDIEQASINKVHLVGSNETIKNVTNFSTEHGVAYLNLLAKRTPLIARKQQIEIIDEFVNKSIAERDQIIRFMKELNMQGNTDKRLWDVLTSNFDFEKERIEKNCKERDELTHQNNLAHLHFVRECFFEYMRLSKLIAPAVHSIRKELNLPFDDVEYNKILEDDAKKQEQALERYLEGLGKHAEV